MRRDSPCVEKENEGPRNLKPGSQPAVGNGGEIVDMALVKPASPSRLGRHYALGDRLRLPLDILGSIGLLDRRLDRLGLLGILRLLRQTAARGAGGDPLFVEFGLLEMRKICCGRVHGSSSARSPGHQQGRCDGFEKRWAKNITDKTTLSRFRAHGTACRLVPIAARFE
jgi:hypothetical protein